LDRRYSVCKIVIPVVGAYFRFIGALTIALVIVVSAGGAVVIVIVPILIPIGFWSWSYISGVSLLVKVCWGCYNYRGTMTKLNPTLY